LAQVVECLPSKHKTLSSNSKKKRKLKKVINVYGKALRWSSDPHKTIKICHFGSDTMHILLVVVSF
jgi:hypothetical protein